MPSSPPAIAGRYQLSEQLGAGGMGVVWRGYDDLLRRPVAVKELHFPPSMNDAERERLARHTLREARAVAAVDDPSAVRVFDIVEQDGRPWIVMEYVHGCTLTELIRDRGPLPVDEVVRIGHALLNALQAAHEAGVLHRDVKPSNVLIGDDGRVALTDFGIATSIDDDGTDTTSSVIVGSPAYMSPERARGEQPTTAADVWSLGATLWTAAEGRPPFDGRSALATMTAVATEPPPLCGRCAGPLGELLLRMMDRDPAARPGLSDIRAGLDRARATTTATEPMAVAYPNEPLPESFDHTTVLDAVVDARPPIPSSPPAAVGAVPAATPAAAPAATPAATSAAPPAATAHRRRRTGLWLVIAVVVLLALGALVVTLLSGGGGNASRGNSGARSHAPGGTESAGSLPAGWHRYTNSSLGWSVGVPSGWQVQSEGERATITDPAGGRYARIDTVDAAGPSALGAWQAQERAFAGSHSGYQRLRLETVSYGSYSDAADWEFTYTSGAVTLHALDRGFVDGGRGYAIYFQTHSGQWSSSRDLLNGFLSSFRPGHG